MIFFVSNFILGLWGAVISAFFWGNNLVTPAYGPFSVNSGWAWPIIFSFGLTLLATIFLSWDQKIIDQIFHPHFLFLNLAGYLFPFLLIFITASLIQYYKRM